MPAAVKLVEAVIAGCLLLNVVQSVEVKRPRLAEDELGKLKVWVPDVLAMDTSVPELPVAKVWTPVVSPFIEEIPDAGVTGAQLVPL